MRRFMLLIWVFMLIVSLQSVGLESEWIVDEEAEDTLRDQAHYLMQGMTVEEKVYQLFFVSPEALTGEKRSTEITDLSVFSRYPVGGVILFGQNIVSEEQVKGLTNALAEAAASSQAFPPLIAVDEEGGSVSRIANKLGYPLELSPEEMGAKGNGEEAKNAGNRIADYLLPLGIHADFAPVADVLIEKESEIVGRAYGADAALVSQMSLAMAEGLRSGGVIPCFKHFPGHGSIVSSTHDGTASSRRTEEEMEGAEWIPFRAAISEGAEMIMISHLTARGLGDDVPASLSFHVIHDILRGKLGFEGVVITDALRMEAITEHYKPGDAALMAFEAGADFLLLPEDFEKAAEKLISSVKSGRISMERLDESVERILALKIQYGLIR